MNLSIALFILIVIVLAVGCVIYSKSKVRKAKETLEFIRGRLDYYFVKANKETRDGWDYNTVEKAINLMYTCHGKKEFSLNVINRKCFIEIVMQSGDIKLPYYYVPPYNPNMKMEDDPNQKSVYASGMPSDLVCAQEFVAMSVAHMQLAKYGNLTRLDLDKVVKDARIIYGKTIAVTDFKISYDNVMVRLSMLNNHEIQIEQVVPCN